MRRRYLQRRIAYDAAAWGAWLSFAILVAIVSNVLLPSALNVIILLLILGTAVLTAVALVVGWCIQFRHGLERKWGTCAKVVAVGVVGVYSIGNAVAVALVWKLPGGVVAGSAVMTCYVLLAVGWLITEVVHCWVYPYPKPRLEIELPVEIGKKIKFSDS